MTELIVPSGPFGPRALNSDAVDTLANKLHSLTGSLVLLIEGTSHPELVGRPLDEVLATPVLNSEVGIVEAVYPDNCCGSVDLQITDRRGSLTNRSIPYNSVHLLQRAVA